jgi:hypothetical protein
MSRHSPQVRKPEKPLPRLALIFLIVAWLVRTLWVACLFSLFGTGVEVAIKTFRQQAPRAVFEGNFWGPVIGLTVGVILSQFGVFRFFGLDRRAQRPEKQAARVCPSLVVASRRGALWGGIIGAVIGVVVATFVTTVVAAYAANPWGSDVSMHVHFLLFLGGWALVATAGVISGAILGATGNLSESERASPGTSPGDSE